LTVLANKIDLARLEPRVAMEQGVAVVYASALTGAGLDLLVAHLKEVAGVDADSSGAFSARRRHLDGLARTRLHLMAARPQLGAALELAAEHLRGAQTALSELTGELTSDDLLGEIFATFCIGK
jgi:tRNA modification GTPase